MKRFKKILVWTALSVGVLLVALLLFFAYYTWSTSRELERRLAELRAQGAPLTIADFAREPIPPETNAAVYLQRAADDVESVQKELMALYPKTGTPPVRLSDEEIKRLDDLFAAHRNLMPLLEQAGACLDYDSQPDVTLSPTAFMEALMDRMSRFRNVIRVLSVRASLLTAKGRFDDALANSILMFKLRERWSREPLILNYLGGVACQSMAIVTANEVLQTGPVSPEIREALDAELARLDSSDSLIWALESERAYTLSSAQELSDNLFWFTGGPRNNLTLRFLDLYDRQLADASRPYWRVEPRAVVRRGWNPLVILVSLLETSMEPLRDAAGRVLAITRSLRVLNALQARGVEEVPADLASLGLPPEAIIDPFDGEPLRVKKLPEGWLVYSVGKDRRGEDGMLNGRRIYGVGPIEEDKP